MRSMTIVITLEIEELHFQISGRPEEHAVETFAPKGADQPFDEWMRQRHVGHRDRATLAGLTQLAAGAVRCSLQVTEDMGLRVQGDDRARRVR